jgi:hypothetical protein
MNQPSSRVLWWRGILFVLLAAWMLSGPVYRQVIGGTSPYIREWRMYGTRAVRTCKVLFEEQDAGGWSPVSRWETEGYNVTKWPGKSRRMLDTRKAANKAGRSMCAKLGEDTVLRYRRKCGHVRDGWGEWETSGNLCEVGP